MPSIMPASRLMGSIKLVTFKMYKSITPKSGVFSHN